jgi:uncharacterized protein (DUF433 family)
VKANQRAAADLHQLALADAAPCIRGLRIPGATIVDMVADGMSVGEIVEAHRDLEPDDVPAALRYAAEVVRERELPLAAAG